MKNLFIAFLIATSFQCSFAEDYTGPRENICTKSYNWAKEYISSKWEDYHHVRPKHFRLLCRSAVGVGPCKISINGTVGRDFNRHENFADVYATGSFFGTIGTALSRLLSGSPVVKPVAVGRGVSIPVGPVKLEAYANHHGKVNLAVMTGVNLGLVEFKAGGVFGLGVVKPETEKKILPVDKSGYEADDEESDEEYVELEGKLNSIEI